jgi:hypothetical protein
LLMTSLYPSADPRRRCNGVMNGLRCYRLERANRSSLNSGFSAPRPPRIEAKPERNLRRPITSWIFFSIDLG